ncbi:SPOR domain-containing protein [Herminiimonas arsenitoxidans]|uniref:SPOR domain-containing protein n=1 Tax=Herminiimonas arsenitoxidans TaxID=1809410 RepID=UPI0009703BA5|nr:SPOR domain-containing protein [Herminiimonas arsenitoxidans]
MLKILFGSLLLINGGLFAFQQGYLDSLIPPSHEPTRLKQQLNPDQLKLVPLASDKPVTEKVATAEPEKTPERVEKVAEVLACTEIGNFDATEAKNFETKLTALALGDRLARRPIQENARYMVYIPPLANKEAADKKAGELKRMGVDDFFVIQDHSALQWGVSLGIFKSEEAARNHLAALNQKGVRSARVGTHSVAANKFAFQLRRIDAATKSGVDKIREGFPRQEWRECSNPPAA